MSDTLNGDGVVQVNILRISNNTATVQLVISDRNNYGNDFYRSEPFTLREGDSFGDIGISARYDFTLKLHPLA